ncbi:MAG: sensor histidine kinase [Bacteroidales bacterium]
MDEGLINSFLDKWHDELKLSIVENGSLCLALFSENGELLFANKTMKELFINPEKPSDNILNPSFEKLTGFTSTTSLIYKGFLTLGNFSSINTSILVRVYRKENEILIIGGVDTRQLTQQNETMHDLNREINNLQRLLIKEKSSLENILRQLNQANIELKEANASKDKFFSIIAHDLKNPFNALLGFSDLLMANYKNMEPQEIEEQLQMLSSASHQAYNLLEDLLMWSKAQQGKITFLPQKIIINDIFDEIQSNLENVAAKKSISVKFDDSPDTVLYADLNMLKTILRNLISNAIKFSPRGSDVKVQVDTENEFARISVSDKGIGISEKNLSRLWQLSEQFTTKGTENEDGTGLGLVLCREFVEKHGGKIWAASEQGNGSDFMFTIPLFDKKYE